MDQKFIDLYDEYYRGLLDRREFLVELAIIAGGTAAAFSPGCSGAPRGAALRDPSPPLSTGL